MKKFRAWDIDNEVMIYSDDPRYLFMCGSNGELGCWERDDEMLNELHLSPMLQYTGLQDKNGKEIYEGDLLKINPYGEEEYTAVVKVIEGSPFCIETPWDGESDYFMLAAYVRHFGNVEVIGSIQESPHLLDKTI